jgi:hypothetical protein
MASEEAVYVARYGWNGRSVFLIVFSLFLLVLGVLSEVPPSLRSWQGVVASVFGLLVLSLGTVTVRSSGEALRV